jgi:hypothetical protein
VILAGGLDGSFAATCLDYYNPVARWTSRQRARMGPAIPGRRRDQPKWGRLSEEVGTR